MKKTTLLMLSLTIIMNLSAQNVGIGTATPQTKLHVSGAVTADTFLFTGNDGSKISLNGAVASHEYTGFGLVAGNLHYQVAGSTADHVFMAATSATTSREIMRIKGNGRIGIGTSSPFFAKLVIGGQPGEEGLDLARANQYANLRVIHNTLNPDDNDMYIGYESGGNSSLHLFSNDNETMTVKNNNVGIGITNPATARLAIAGIPGQEGLDLASTDQYANLRVIRNSLHTADKDMYIGYGSGPASSLHLFSNNTETMTIKEGKIGIGTTAPFFGKLVIGGQSGEEGLNLSQHDQVAELRVLRNSLNAGDKDMYIGSGSGNTSSLHLFSDNVEALTVKNRRIGIRTTNPMGDLQFPNTFNSRRIVLYDLGANNDHQFNGFGITNASTMRYQISSTGGSHVFHAGTSATTSNTIFTLFGSGNATLAGTLTQNSDVRLKTNIQRIINPLELLKNINGYTYNWKDPSKDNKTQTGVVAQEVQKVYPELVNADDKGILSVNYIGLVPVLIESIKELRQQNISLQKAVDELLGRMDKAGLK